MEGRLDGGQDSREGRVRIVFVGLERARRRGGIAEACNVYTDVLCVVVLCCVVLCRADGERVNDSAKAPMMTALARL